MLPIRTILHATDFSEHSLYACRLAHALARDYGAKLILLHVMPPPVTYGEGFGLPELPKREDDLRQHLAALAEKYAGVPVTTRLEVGSPVEEILRAAGETGCDLIVMGTHGRTGIGRLLMGSIAEAVVRKAPCLVLTVKVPFGGPDARGEPAAAAEVPATGRAG